ncbi:hypothetical protein LSUE1_G002099 [Lachnellula suecica]|uniref:DUF6604 domain-containing protein n=1 Tax=Lachnellula suecica TaxID=602035 RepID=A0A8T9CLW4_9HELO|nr:hypothetical protein LSUE1_G002099 [Lachnellula suecica]
MALDPFLFDTYKQYKAGTNKVMTWLASRSQEASGSSSVVQKASASKSTGRLKGKERKAAKKETSHGQKHLVALADIPRMAKSIVATTKVGVPQNIIRTLEEVIAARCECNDFFEQDVNSATLASNQSHQHFTAILRETLQILKPLSRASDPTRKAKGKSADAEADKETIDLRNRFEFLEVEEPTKWTSGAVPVKSNKMVNTYDLEPKDEDVSFAIFCLLKDLTDIRHYIRQTWAEYREHQIAFTTAALTMNTAIAIFRRLNEEFISEFPEFDDHGAIIDYLSYGYRDPNTSDKHSKDFATYTGSTFKVSSKIFFCDNTYELMSFFLTNSVMPFYQEGVDCGLRFTEDEKALLRCLSLLGLLNSEFNGDFFNDQLIQGLHILKTNNPDQKLYTWVVFAVQLFVDTRRVVGNELGRCFTEAKELEGWMTTALEQSFIFGSTNTVNESYKLNGHLLSTLNKQITGLLKEDLLQRILHERFGNGAHAARYSWGPFYLFRNHPMLLGLLVQHFLVKMHEIGIGLTGDQGAVMTAIHLYNACQQSTLISRCLEWTDIEKVIEWQGASWIFMGDRPKTAQSCFRHLGLVMGVSATVMSRDRRGKPTVRMHKNSRATSLPISQKRNRKLRLMSTYVDLMNKEPQSQWKTGGVRWVPTRAATEPLVMLEMLVAKYLDSNTSTTPALGSNTSTHPKAHPLSMLTVFKESLKSEEAVFRFDLLGLNQRCVELLLGVQRVCIVQSPLDYPWDEYSADREIGECVSHMLAGELGLERKQPTRFFEASGMVRDVIRVFGNEEYQKSRSRCFIKGDGNKKVTDAFLTPYEDVVLLSERAQYGRIIIDDGSSGLTII